MYVNYYIIKIILIYSIYDFEFIYYIYLMKAY